MPIQEQVHRERLRGELAEMFKLPQTNMIQWKVHEDDPSPREPTRYVVTFNIRSIVGERNGRPVYRDHFVVDITLSPDYPFSKPKTHMRDRPYPYHPNWWSSGDWCSGDHVVSEVLPQYIMRMARVLRFDPSIANLNSVANHEAVPFWERYYQNASVMPSDTQPLPCLRTAPRIVIRS